MPLIANANTKKFDIPTAQFTACAAPSTGSTETCAWRVTVKAKSDGLPHQLTREEIILALSGSATAQIGTEKYVVAAGDTLIVPAFVDFTLSNPNETDFSAIAILPVGGQAVIGSDAPFTPPWAA
jgi:mannose-6-phosphate isomerase-like protein (cupin superfamily)